jgi:hypothetical protein
MVRIKSRYGDRDPEPVRRFELLAADLHRLAEWAQSCGVKAVLCSRLACTGLRCTADYRGHRQVAQNRVVRGDRGILVYLSRL